MSNKLKDYFPMLRSRKEVLDIIRGRQELVMIFDQWPKKGQEEFLDFCTGARGIKMLYDSFFKEIFNPEIVPERLNELLSLLLGMEVKILHVMPNDNSRIADESSLLVMDIVVRLQDGSIANIEVQKIPYSFPGQRSACYSADLLLRQYKAVREEAGRRNFSYRDIKTVYTIVFFEKSTAEFHKYPDEYLHYFQQVSNTGLDINLLQKYLFIPLDIFRENQHNKGIQNRLEAWLLFLCSDNPEDIISVIEHYPDFKALYEQVYDICLNVERVMGMFSKELQELDRNTVQYMIDEMQDKIDRLAAEKEQVLEEKERISEEKECISEEKQRIAEEKQRILEENERISKEKEFISEENQRKLQEKDKSLAEKEQLLQDALRRIKELEENR